MSNPCFYTMHAVSKNEETLKRLLNIMNEQDNEYFIFRCDQANLERNWKEKDLFIYDIRGSVAWTCSYWIGNVEKKDADHTLPNGAHYVTLDILAKRLDFGFEIYAEEDSNQFEQHIHCTHKGKTEETTLDYEEDWDDVRDESKKVGGFGYDFCNFLNGKKIYG